MVVFQQPLQQDKVSNFIIDMVIRMESKLSNQTNIQKGSNFKHFQETRIRNKPRIP